VARLVSPTRALVSTHSRSLLPTPALSYPLPLVPTHPCPSFTPSHAVYSLCAGASTYGPVPACMGAQCSHTRLCSLVLTCVCPYLPEFTRVHLRSTSLACFRPRSLVPCLRSPLCTCTRLGSPVFALSRLCSFSPMLPCTLPTSHYLPSCYHSR
jgi:hypothetical protein